MQANPPAGWGESSSDGPQPRRTERIVDSVRRALPGFAFEGEIGRGGTAVILRAREVALDRPVAIKILTTDFAAPDRIEQIFLDEARAIARLDHPNIIQIFSAGVAAGHFYLVLQHAEGETLESALRRDARKEPIDPARALKITREVALALAAAHRRGVIHRDIKPSNIMIGAEARVKVMDFGLAGGRLLEAAGSRQGLFIGTPHYASPEQCRMDAGEDLDPRTDLYSLGVVLYQMLTGTLPHIAGSPQETMERVLSDEPAPIEDLAPHASRQVHALVRRLMAKPRGDRHPDADAVCREIDAILDAGDARRQTRWRTRAAAGASSGSVRRPAWRDTTSILLATASLLLLVAAALLVARVVAKEDSHPRPAIGVSDTERKIRAVIAPALVDPTLGDALPGLLERHALAAVARIDGVLVQSPSWAKDRTGRNATGSAFLEALARALPDEDVYAIQVFAESPETGRVQLEIALYDVSSTRRILSVQGEADADGVALVAATAAVEFARGFESYLREPWEVGPEPARRWVEIEGTRQTPAGPIGS